MTPGVAVVLHLALQAGAVVLGWRLARGATARRRVVLLTIAVALLALTLALTTGPWLLRVLPLPDLALLGNQVPLAAGLLGGMALATPGLARWRRILVLGVLLVAADGTCLWPLVQPRPPTFNLWDGGACLQTSAATCAPAAAATILRLHGIAATEGQLAEWCLTTAKGTTRWGLWRGLCALTEGTPWTVRSTDGPPPAELGSEPLLVSVMLTAELDRRDPRYRQKWGWLLGQPHAVLYLGPGSTPGHVRMADPKIGVEEWDEEGLRALWNGQVFRLVRR